MLTSATGRRDFEALTLEGEITRTIYLVKVGGAMTGELTPAFYEAEAEYERSRKDFSKALYVMQKMAARIAKQRDITVQEAQKLLQPPKRQVAAAESGGEVEVLAPEDSEESSYNPINFIDVENQETGLEEIRALMSGGQTESAETRSAYLKYLQAIATSVLRSRLASTVEVSSVEGSELVLSEGAGTFFSMNKGDKLRFGDQTVTVAAHVPLGAARVPVEGLPNVKGVGFLQDPTGSDRVGMVWKDEYTAMMPESQLIQIADFFNKERTAPPEGDPQLEHPAERNDVFDDPIEAVGNSPDSSNQSNEAIAQTGTQSEGTSAPSVTPVQN